MSIVVLLAALAILPSIFAEPSLYFGKSTATKSPTSSLGSLGSSIPNLPPAMFTNNPSGASGSPRSSDSPVSTHTIMGGTDGHWLEPETTVADVGDIIEFDLSIGVARSTFARPCVPIEISSNKQGFWSGFYFFADAHLPSRKFQVTVNDTDPIYFYCTAPGACSKGGAVGSINAVSGETIEHLKEHAITSGEEIFPGQALPSQPAATTPPATRTSSLSPEKISGISLGGAAALIISAMLIYLCRRRRKLNQTLPQYSSMNAPKKPRAEFTESHHPDTKGLNLFQLSRRGVKDSSAIRTESHGSLGAKTGAVEEIDLTRVVTNAEIDSCQILPKAEIDSYQIRPKVEIDSRQVKPSTELASNPVVPSTEIDSTQILPNEVSSSGRNSVTEMEALPTISRESSLVSPLSPATENPSEGSLPEIPEILR
ncbi:hypothetical protein B0O99DRAFT_14393 [Bisporella sp. PMI_857]|nr:hypothetical protein B0O99DRAFT_14393 [Bisporella sp. PMI_857]